MVAPSAPPPPPALPLPAIVGVAAGGAALVAALALVAFLCRRRMRSAIPVAPPTSAASPTPSEPWSLGSEK